MAPIKKDIEVLDEERKEIEEYLINELPKSQLEGVSGKLANAKIVTKKVPTAKDWDSIYKYISKTKSWDLLNKAINRKAVEDRWADGKQIPGIEVFNKVSVSLTKAK